MAIKGICIVTKVHWEGIDTFNVELQYCSCNGIRAEGDANLAGLSSALNATQLEDAIKDYIKRILISQGIQFGGGDTVRLLGAIA